MKYDYYAYRKEQLDEANLLKNFEQSVIDLKRARGNTRQDAEQRMNQVAKQVLQFAEDQEVEPHLPYFWYDIQSSDCKNYIRDAWQKNLIFEKIPEDFGFIPSISDLENLPQLSFMLRVPFKLKKPYLSKDDRSFHLLDNPVRKDKVFQTPMVAPTSWKGALRAALWQLEHKEESEQIIRLFGNDREEEDHEKLKSGRLYFYPTFFDNIDKQKQLEVINPHDRKKGTGKNPILIESVPIGATGEFVILYVPFGKVEERQVIEDLELVVKGVKEMLTVYGFGAKTSSGFGSGEISKNEYFPSKEEYRKSRLEENKTYSEKIYEADKARYENEKIPLPTVYFANASVKFI
ncbi:RAMP superfamily CRISPR-associated protein [Cronbergia sp. UHCC 0137]|uniref:RAMP superfamily CRISPR-associated protein n=1 Tax=Cronbergia sp. UHCC 0137 TaxID=3110239 RepID=UPI002B216A4F|nr:RAMP superfamily CRISPR-associated protein [Cronbergia sp. UHCC 0137]MEA5617956.1 RAMP superfamily CRISPR-associated protein [Cronbergia sp. UHCC 0137]